MYNIHNHYLNIYSLATSIIAEPSVLYLYPFGSSGTENVEILGNPAVYPEDQLPGVYMAVLPGWYPRSGPVFVCYDQEPLISGFNRTLFNHVKKEYVWGPDGLGHPFHQDLILVNTELDSDEKDQILSEHGFKDCYYFHHAFAAHDWYRGYKYLKSLIPVHKRTINKKFITFNRITSNARIYRSLLINELIDHSILEQGHVSFSKQCPDGGNYADELAQNAKWFSVPESLVASTITNIESSSSNFRIDYAEHELIPNNSFHISAISENMESFVHVVTETCYWGRKKHLTEKIFKPIVMRQPFILVGCAHNLEYLKRYGFKTFDSWWDESYDQIDDDIERMHAIGQLLADICKKDLSQLQKILNDMEDVLDYNYNWFYSHSFLDMCWDELETNLRNAITSKPLPHIDPQTYQHRYGHSPWALL